MKKLTYFWISPFKSDRISVIGLIRFGTDMLQRLKARNVDGQFDGYISALETALAAMIAAFATDVGKLGIRKARKITKNRFRKALSQTIETIAAALTASFGAGSAELKEFFPHGRRIFSQCPDDELEGHLTSLADQVTAHEGQLGAELVSEASDLLDQWLDIHEASEESTGQKANTEAERRDIRANLEDELFDILLMLGSRHKNEPEKQGLYMQQYLLGGPSTGPVSGGGNPLPPAGGSTSGSTSGSSGSVGSVGSGSTGSGSSGSVSSSSMSSSSSVGSSSAGSSSGSTSSGSSSSS